MANPWLHSTNGREEFALGGLQQFAARQGLKPEIPEKNSSLETLTQLRQLSDLHQTVLERTKQIERLEATHNADEILTPQRIDYRINEIRSCRMQMEQFIRAAESILQILRAASIEDAIPIELEYQEKLVELFTNMTQFSKYSKLQNLDILDGMHAAMTQYPPLIEKLQESIQQTQSIFNRLKSVEKAYEWAIMQTIN
ncbi:unnamed protein product [Albugo candida]|uniref:Uncharacterized protein n=1 Tax=Albugo candida TaxID=65357 RepID=A0A024GPZ5_9STRA|nr:unnamed protein product [Albugo candida]CCI48940.1 unnamed protein product [Albugo candida]|eukprot:CCI48933.1 unnamed protein product [Albugo candida]